MGRTDSLAPQTRTSARPSAAIGGWLAALLDWRPLALMAVCAALIVVFSQVPQRYDFEVGRIAGPESDLPFLQGFHPQERAEDGGGYRWSKAEEARIELPGLGRRGVIVDMDIVSHRAQWDTSAPPTLVTLQSGEVAAFSFPLRREGARYQVYLPPEALTDGVLRLDLRTPIWHKPGDSRDELGVALGRRVLVAALPGAGLVLPDRALLLGWTASLALLWIALRVLRFSRRMATLLLLPLALGAPLLLLLDAPRLGFGSRWAIQFGLLNIVAALVTAWALPPLLKRLGASAPPAILRWLALLVVLSFSLKYGGRFYPDAMIGDLQLHVNRYTGTITGQVYIAAQHRGLPFPFPTGPYLLLAPLTLLGLDIRMLLALTAGMFEAATVPLLYLVGARALGSPRLGLLAGAIYAITAAGFMTTWFAFETQVAAQWFSIALFALLVLAWPRYDRRVWWLALMLLLQVFLGHIGLFINVALMGLLAAPLLWWGAHTVQERRAAMSLLLLGVVGVAFTLLFFYSAFTGLIIEQVGGVAADGLNGVTGRNPIPRETTLWVTWDGGLITHYGFFPVLLMIPGAILLWAGGDRATALQGHGDGGAGGDRGAGGEKVTALQVLVWMTLLVSFSQAVLPLITLSSITTRWLTFASWAVAVAGALGAAQLWRRGRIARVAGVTMALYVGWLTLALYVAAMALRVAPIEPF